MSDETAPATATSGGLLERLGDDLLMLDRELSEIDLLVTQAKTEAARHEGRRVAGTDKLAALGDDADPKERADQAAALITLTRRAALMETQVEVLEGKRRALGRYRDAVAEYLEGAGGLPFSPGAGGASVALPDGAPGGPADATDGTTALPAAVSRLVLSAQEDLRREIARAMHDGPAQSLTNIVLQAQIVERLVARDPATASGEIRQLTAMVQQTLDATKSFIFDVRPMVLDDLGLVPTLRRAARERGRRAGIPVVFESMGQDRRLPVDLESGIFRMLDEALAAYLGAGPERVTLLMDWGERLEARLVALRATPDDPAEAAHVAPERPGRGKGRDKDKDQELPPTLVAMIEDREAGAREAAEAARLDALIVLPPTVWRHIQARAASIGVEVEQAQEGAELRLSAPIAGEGSGDA
ncbi:MAG: sensor histidine kinase [Candidatus Limnocylindria bacterium]